MNIRDKIRENLSEIAVSHRVKDIRIGLGYTAVMLDNGKIGLAYTPHRDMPAGCSVFPDFMPPQNAAAKELLDLIISEHRIETAVGLATANALITSRTHNYTTGDVLETMSLHADDHVGMVGHFAPLVAPIRKKAAALMIFEQIDHSRDGLLPSTEIEKRLP